MFQPKPYFKQLKTLLAPKSLATLEPSFEAFKVALKNKSIRELQWQFGSHHFGMRFDPSVLQTQLVVYQTPSGPLKKKPKQIERFRVMPPKHLELVTFYEELSRPQTWEWDLTLKAYITHSPALFATFYHKLVGPQKQNDVLQAAYKQANWLYHESGQESFLTDGQFDQLEEYLVKHKLFNDVKPVGSAVVHGTKVTLPHPMGSLEKIKTEKDVLKWAKLTAKPMIVTPKLDGMSVLLVYRRKKLYQAITRGDGQTGKDVTQHAQSIPSIPKTITDERLSVRAELIMDRTVFDKNFKKSPDYKEGFANPRNLVAGQINRKTSDKSILKHIDCIVHDVVSHDDLDKDQRLQLAENNGFKTVTFSKIVVNAKSFKFLQERLQVLRNTYPFECDGLVLEVNAAQERNKIGFETNSLNPKYARAFKTEADIEATGHVKKVEWAVSKDGYLKPVVLIEPTPLAGVVVSKLTGFNAAFIRDNKIGPETVLQFKRSGDVIPHITKVTYPSHAQMPSEKTFGEMVWTDTNIDLVLVDKATNIDWQKQSLIYFFKTTGIEFFSEGWVERFYEAGFKTLHSILSLSTKQMQQVEGVQQKLANKFKFEFEKLKTLHLPVLMKASGCFGRNFGETKATILYQEYKDDVIYGWKNTTVGDIASTVAQLNGFSYETGLQFAKGLKPFVLFLQTHKGLIGYKPWQAPKLLSKRLQDVAVVFTGFRDSQLEKVILDNGGIVQSGVSAKTTHVLTPDPSANSVKLQKARELKKSILTPEQFTDQFKL